MTGDLFSPLPWYERPFAALDFEATSTDPFTARPVSFAVAIVNVKGEIVEQHADIINCGVECSAEATAVHGITNEMMREQGVEPLHAAIFIREFVFRIVGQQMPLCIMNARYDWTLLRAELMRFGGFEPAPVEILDPGLLDKGVDRYRKGKRKLSDLCKHYGVTLEGAHTAVVDAVAAAKLSREIILRHPRIRMVTHAGALAEWQAHVFEEYRRFLCRGNSEKGVAPKVIAPGWPIAERVTS